MTIKTISFDSLMLYFNPIISEEVLDEVQLCYQSLQALEGIIDLIPSYNSILVNYDSLKYSDISIKKKIEKIYASSLSKNSMIKSTKLIKIPTNYSKNLDLERVAKYNKISVDEVITLHTERIYRVYAIGFMVGFSYLAEIDKQIATPRLESPRSRVPKGSVAIADRQTAIYPQDSAGGWNIIGHTEFTDFENFSVGDSVQFVRV